MIGDYVEISARAFDEPYLDDLRALVRVCGDHFESEGDPRGTLISLGEERYDALGKRAYELAHAIDEHVLAHHEHELGKAAELLRMPRTCDLDWRCGQLYGARLDLRRVKRDDVGPMVTKFVMCPAAHALRRLTVRVRQDRDVGSALEAIERHVATTLEELYVLREVRPRQMAGYGGSAIRTRLTQLYAFAQRDTIYSLVSGPTSPKEDRTAIGRALTSNDPSQRSLALERIADMGERGAVFVDLLALLLQPQLWPRLEIVETLRAIGPAARRALPVLTKVPGRVSVYDRETRSAAGRLIQSLLGTVAQR